MTKQFLRVYGFASLTLLMVAVIYASAKLVQENIGNVITSSPLLMAAAIANLIFYPPAVIVATLKLLTMFPRNPG